MQKEISIPFEGFYETNSGETVESNLINEWNYKNNVTDDRELTDAETESRDEYMTDNWKRGAQEYAEAYANGLASLLSRDLGMPVTFSDVIIDSPRFYNFTTDRIFAKVSREVLALLFARTDYAKLAEHVKENFTSRDGFASHYEGDINSTEWQNIELYDHNQWRAVLDVFMEQNEVERYELAN